jgi:hypothetical protein
MRVLSLEKGVFPPFQGEVVYGLFQGLRIQRWSFSLLPLDPLVCVFDSCTVL